MKEIPLGRSGLVALVDDGDHQAAVAAGPWYAFRRRFAIYAYRTGRRGPPLYLHQLVMQPSGIKQIDHIDHDGLNNQRSNLRVASSQQNTFNRRSLRGTSSRFKGVTLGRRGGKWRVQIRVNRQKYSGGSFDNEIDAARERDVLTIQFHGEEFGLLNFPEHRAQTIAEANRRPLPKSSPSRRGRHSQG